MLSVIFSGTDNNKNRKNCKFVIQLGQIECCLNIFIIVVSIAYTNKWLTSQFLVKIRKKILNFFFSEKLHKYKPTDVDLLTPDRPFILFKGFSLNLAYRFYPHTDIYIRVVQAHT